MSSPSILYVCVYLSVIIFESISYWLSFQVWRTSTSEFVRTLHGHRRGIACLQYRGNHVVSGSSDNTIRIWDIECGACLRMLEGHDDLVRYDEGEREREREEGGMGDIRYPLTMFFIFHFVRCIRFDDKRIVSGAYDGYVVCVC